MVKVTKQMVDRAMAYHFRTETARSLDKANALAYLYYKQQGNNSTTRMYAKIVNRDKDVKAMVQKIQSGKPIRKRIRRKPSAWKPSSVW